MALDSKLKQFLDENPYVGAVTTLRQDCSPHTTVVWVDTEDGKVSFNTARGRAKERHIARDSRVSLIVIDPNDPYKWVSVTGHAELTEEGATPQIDKLAKKYIGQATYPWRDPQQTRVKVLIEPEKVDSSGFDS